MILLLWFNSVLKSLLSALNHTENAPLELIYAVDIKQISSGSTNHNVFGDFSRVLSIKNRKFSSFNPCPSLPSFSTDETVSMPKYGLK